MTTVSLALDPNINWYLTLALLVLGAVVGTVWAYRVWTNLEGDPGDDASTNPREHLSPLAQAYAAGQMSEEEFRRIQESIRRGEPTAFDPAPKPVDPRRLPVEPPAREGDLPDSSAS